ncbi:MAG: glycine/betaine ABC transporter substrate-binding protein, partial [Bauldia sp.]
EKAYDFEAGRANVRPMDLGLTYPALANGDLDTISAQATDGQIAALKLRVLEDDKHFFPNYALTPVVRKEVLDQHPDLKETLEAVSTKLDDATMQRLNSEVDVDKKTVEAVAADYLKSVGM